LSEKTPGLAHQNRRETSRITAYLMKKWMQWRDFISQIGVLRLQSPRIAEFKLYAI